MLCHFLNAVRMIGSINSKRETTRIPNPTPSGPCEENMGENSEKWRDREFEQWASLSSRFTGTQGASVSQLIALSAGQSIILFFTFQFLAKDDIRLREEG